MADQPLDPSAGAPLEDEGAEASPGSAAGDLSQGYCIELSVLPDGTFKVSGPEPLQEEAEEEQGEAGSEMGQDFDSVGAALKGVLQIIQANPTAGDAQSQMDAGFASR